MTPTPPSSPSPAAIRARLSRLRDLTAANVGPSVEVKQLLDQALDSVDLRCPRFAGISEQAAMPFVQCADTLSELIATMVREALECPYAQEGGRFADWRYFLEAVVDLESGERLQARTNLAVILTDPSGVCTAMLEETPDGIFSAYAPIPDWIQTPALGPRSDHPGRVVSLPKPPRDDHAQAPRPSSAAARAASGARTILLGLAEAPRRRRDARRIPF